MQTPTIFADTQALADAAAAQAIAVLGEAIAAHSRATWVLAGGSTPMQTYRRIAEAYLDKLDWSRITFIIGDERIAPLDSPDSNWQAVEQTLLRHIPSATFLRPLSDQPAELAAADYTQQLARLPQHAGLPRFDLVWLGVGEDGHTLSLFPDHPSSQPTNQLVIPVHDAPKPPADRISLSLHALSGTQQTTILAAGAGKAAILQAAFAPDSTLPIAEAALRTNAQWLLDTAAAAMLY